MELLFPALPGMQTYQKSLRRITKKSNDLLLNIVEDLSYVFSDGRVNPWKPAEVEKLRKRILADFRKQRNAFVFRHESILLEALEQQVTPLSPESQSLALSLSRRVPVNCDGTRRRAIFVVWQIRK